MSATMPENISLALCVGLRRFGAMVGVKEFLYVTVSRLRGAYSLAMFLSYTEERSHLNFRKLCIAESRKAMVGTLCSDGIV